MIEYYRAFSRLERSLFACFAVTSAVAAACLWQINYSPNYISVPVAGGYYHEGTLLGSSRDIDIAKDGLTKVGLVRLDDSAAIKPALATSWKVSEDCKAVDVTLDNRITAQAASDALSKMTGAGYWQDAKIKVIDDHTLEFQLDKPWAGFVAELVTPVFPFGPYKFVKSEVEKRESKTTLYFETNEQALEKPLIPKMALELFQDSDNLGRSVRRGEVQGAYLTDIVDMGQPSSWQVSELNTHREEVLFMNVKQPQLADVAVRKNLVNNQPLSNRIELHMVAADTTQSLDAIQQVSKKLKALNVDLKVNTYPLLTLTSTVLPARDYDLALVGIDYGADGDLYPYWHSSQIAAPGNNFSGYRNKDVDKLLDSARQEKDANKRHGLFDQARAKILDDAAMVVIDSPKVVFMHQSDLVTQLPGTVNSAVAHWQDIASWSLKTKRVHK